MDIADIIDMMPTSTCLQYLYELLKPFGMEVTIRRRSQADDALSFITYIEDQQLVVVELQNDSLYEVEFKSPHMLFKALVDNITKFMPARLHGNDKQILNPYLGATSIEELKIRKDLIS